MHSPRQCVDRAPLFHNLAPQVKAKLSQISSHRVYYAKGSLIRQPHDQQAGMLVLDQGQAKVYYLTAAGQEQITEILSTGSIRGQQQLFQEQPSEQFIQALTDSWVCSITQTAFQNLLQASPDLAQLMVNSLGQQLWASEQKNLRHELLDAQGLVWDYLQNLAEQKQTLTFDLPIKKKELANLLGITPETLSRRLHQLVRAGKLEMQGAHFHLQATASSRD
ncbi:Crp/Fnr family transcriptional regulator [Lactobacillus sp. DCY120]|uniref:Crp/Fnr family transcriptional regulator n=1 Tax=Bombilactobacillus apium TaxID=2675299 RepID=A0A850R2S9_9LACO|nr:Crp/Fnr family transcriptional regulator [Bombilactobacillus apium]NVY96660.1 Crp/Fnr family transcriptional regulator [Bombilactobacillus apium]